MRVSTQIINGKITTNKQNKQLHGFGLESIQHLTMQYDGEFSMTYQDDTFILTVMLKNRKNANNQEGMKDANSYL